MKMFLERVEFVLLSTLFVLLLIGTGDANRELSGGDDSVTSKPVTSQPSSSVVLTKVVTLKPSKSLMIHSFMILYIVYFVHSGNSHTSCTLSKREAIIHLYFLWIYVKLIIFPLTYLFMIPIKIKLLYAMLNAHYKNNMVCNVFKLYFDNIFFPVVRTLRLFGWRCTEFKGQMSNCASALDPCYFPRSICCKWQSECPWDITVDDCKDDKDHFCCKYMWKWMVLAMSFYIFFMQD